MVHQPVAEQQYSSSSSSNSSSSSSSSSSSNYSSELAADSYCDAFYTAAKCSIHCAARTTVCLAASWHSEQLQRTQEFNKQQQQQRVEVARNNVCRSTQLAARSLQLACCMQSCTAITRQCTSMPAHVRLLCCSLNALKTNAQMNLNAVVLQTSPPLSLSSSWRVCPHCRNCAPVWRFQTVKLRAGPHILHNGVL
jgi:hypothetical protein